MGCYGSRPAPVPQPPTVNSQAISQGLPPRVKLVLLGDTGVGKSCLAVRYVKGHFDAGSKITVGAAFMSHNVALPDGKLIKFEIWDTAGQERYLSLAPLYYRGAHAALVVFDITSAETFLKAKYWIGELHKNASVNTILMLVGNKTDLEPQREVMEEEARNFADSHGMMYMEASAKASTNVHEVFESVAAKLAGGLPVSSHAGTRL